jgi:hypothetical protein
MILINASWYREDAKMFRQFILRAIVVGFIVIGTLDIHAGNWRTGLASIMLGLVNGLLLGGEK